MAIESSLDGLKVLVTRPKHQAHSLCEMIANAGGEVLAIPTLDIVPIDVGEFTGLDQQDMIIFVSRNAVMYFGAKYKNQLADDVINVAVGASTAQCMQEHGFEHVLQAPAPAGTESLLVMPELTDVDGKQILIVRGQDGRELLADTLAERGAITRYIEVYQRNFPKPSNEMLQQAMLAECIVISSVNSLANLCQLLGKENIKNKHLIVVSNRIKQYAIEQGFNYIDVAEGASDGALMQRINKVG